MNKEIVFTQHGWQRNKHNRETKFLKNRHNRSKKEKSQLPKDIFKINNKGET